MPIRALPLILLAGCSVVAPPPGTPAHDLAQAKPEGTTSISLVGGWAFGVWMDDGFGGALRVGHQVDARSELGVDLLVGKRRGWSRAAEASAATNRYQDCLVRDRQRSGHPTIFSFPCKRREVEAEPGLLLGARGWWRRSIADGQPHAVVAGAGFIWVDNGMRTLTLDGAIRWSTSNGSFDGQVGPVLALSIPVVRGPAFYLERRPRTTLYVGASGGAVANADGDLSGSLELTTLYGLSPNDGIWLSAASAATTWRP